MGQGDSITVTIPAQKEYDTKKYLGYPCYLEEALLAAGYKDVLTFGVGRTKIGEVRYVTKEPFGGGILKRAFAAGESVTVTLIRS